MKKLFHIMVIFLAFLASSFDSYACEINVAVSNDQVKELRDVIINPSSDELDVILAYETLKCAERETIREFAITSALKSNSDALKNLVVRDLFLSKDVLTVQLSVDKTASPLALKAIEADAQFSANVRSTDLKTNKMKIDISAVCGSLVSYDAQEIDLRLGCHKYMHIEGRLSFDGKGFSGDLALTVEDKKAGKIKGYVGLLK